MSEAKRQAEEMTKELVDKLVDDTGATIAVAMAWVGDRDIPTMAISAHAPSKDVMIAFLKAAVVALESTDGSDGRVIVDVRGKFNQGKPEKGN